MKKSIIILSAVIITLGLMAFSVINWNDSDTVQLKTRVSKGVAVNLPAMEKKEKNIFTDFIYGVGPRFSPIKKSDVDKARSINDFYDEEHMQSIVSIKSVSVILIINDKQSDIRETGYSEELTSAQLKLLQSSDYSTNFIIRTDYRKRNKETGRIENSYSTPYLTVVPEKQAEYVNGKDALMKFLINNSKEAIARAFVDEDKLQPAKLFFTVTKNGTIENVHLDRSSNYPSVDKFMIELIKKLPAEWKPAENHKGEKVDQQLVVSFGLMGC